MTVGGPQIYIASVLMLCFMMFFMMCFMMLMMCDKFPGAVKHGRSWQYSIKYHCVLRCCVPSVPHYVVASLPAHCQFVAGRALGSEEIVVDLFLKFKFQQTSSSFSRLVQSITRGTGKLPHCSAGERTDNLKLFSV